MKVHRTVPIDKFIYISSQNEKCFKTGSLYLGPFTSSVTQRAFPPPPPLAGRAATRRAEGRRRDWNLVKEEEGEGETGITRDRAKEVWGEERVYFYDDTSEVYPKCTISHLYALHFLRKRKSYTYATLS